MRDSSSSEPASRRQRTGRRQRNRRPSSRRRQRRRSQHLWNRPWVRHPGGLATCRPRQCRRTERVAEAASTAAVAEQDAVTREAVEVSADVAATADVQVSAAAPPRGRPLRTQVAGEEATAVGPAVDRGAAQTAGTAVDAGDASRLKGRAPATGRGSDATRRFLCRAVWCCCMVVA